MKIKIVFDDKDQEFDVVLTPDRSKDVIIPSPKKLDQPVYFPLGTEHQKALHKHIKAIFPHDELCVQDVEEFKRINAEIKALTDAKRELTMKARERMNPKVVEACEDFVLKNAELFI